jgi:hypothetical protein
MSIHRYPPRGLTGDYVRAAVGLALTMGPFLMVPLGSVASWIFGPLALLFLAFGWHTFARQATRVELSPSGISLLGPRRASLAWEALRSVQLSYYATKSDRAGGWMQLTLKGDGPSAKVRIDSSLEGFDAVARQAAAAAEARAIDVSEATRANFDALGIALGEGGDPAGRAA